MAKRKETEIYLKDYLSGKLQEEARRRKEELLYPTKPREKELGVKVQTSKRTDQLEQEVLSYVEDGTYVFITGQLRRIEKCLEFIKSVDEEGYKIMILFYRQQQTWDYISQEMNLSRSACISKRNKWIKELMDWI